ncbi:uncharacterized protein LOC18438879 [Amborella trichopoda]|uniref:Uncharacterized protein n=1 Tax=Amborella trichopoda TaxID=13333 RepID=W1PRQ0_AMBTC|nr:uncharacterized protein LOC18438879 [Amborella trichopoda]XP_020525884.1 uncharacterized protein LOC18438879 [Amborella trichopoda]XP_020525885.1 uncharacterized protein LOC18438879 [Amborella trichopoda]XP_020525886.1 uncharacterized protein LOC18438879 [Amborella trichopoda]XP_020525887.1 uncharacterized protein LOC18438879 [Amborella trichopoda]XP_020525888.1 uncharacterized protein LOC18438879 [Amborella trichopoda]ERN10703.1 hypothetical protein AMTR_s00027p00048440 [Amborella trichop|eukprot:XP_006849122.1 uncharacterized protein LOC18438879 [Amborella trichopoda]
MCRSFETRLRDPEIADILAIKTFKIRLSIPAVHLPIPDTLTLLYPPRNPDTRLEVNKSPIRPKDYASVSLARVKSPGKSLDEAVFTSRDEMRIGSGMCFEVRVGGARLARAWVLRAGMRWWVECETFESGGLGLSSMEVWMLGPNALSLMSLKVGSLGSLGSCGCDALSLEEMESCACDAPNQEPDLSGLGLYSQEVGSRRKKGMRRRHAVWLDDIPEDSEVGFAHANNYLGLAHVDSNSFWDSVRTGEYGNITGKEDCGESTRASGLIGEWVELARAEIYGESERVGKWVDIAFVVGAAMCLGVGFLVSSASYKRLFRFV